MKFLISGIVRAGLRTGGQVGLKVLGAQLQIPRIPAREFARRRGGRQGRTSVVGKGKRPGSIVTSNRGAPPPAEMDPTDPWQEVRDEASGQVYWWNTVTDETTALGEPKPKGMYALSDAGQIQGQPSMVGMMAQGAAWGFGSGIAHSVVGSVLGGGAGGDVGDSFDGGLGSGDEGSSGDGSDQNDDGSWDI